MTQYRIVKYKNKLNEYRYKVQTRDFFFWHTILNGLGAPAFEYTLEDAKKVIELLNHHDKKFSYSKVGVIG